MDLRAPRLAIALTALAAAVVSVTPWAHGGTRPSAFTGVATSPEQADQRAAVMLDRAYQVGSVRLPQPAGTATQPSRPHEVEQSRWLSAPGSPTDVVEAIAAHPPPGFVVTSSTRLTRATDEAYYGQALVLKPTDEQDSSLHVLDVTAIPATASHSTVHLQATVGWVPPPTPAGPLPGLIRLSGPTPHPS